MLVALNFFVSARLIGWAAARSLALLQGAVLGGFIVRLFALTLIVLGLEQFSFIDIPVLVLTIAVTHIALLIWETRYVSLTLAAPGLKPGVVDREPKDEGVAGVTLGVFVFPPIDELFRWKDIAFKGSSTRSTRRACSSWSRRC